MPREKIKKCIVNSLSINAENNYQQSSEEREITAG